METNEVLIALAKLEATLQDIETAKNQVKQTVKAYSELKDQFSEYAQPLESISGSIHGLISEIQNKNKTLVFESGTILASYETKVNEVLSRLSDALATNLETTKNELNAIDNSFSTDCNNTASAFKENTNAVLRELNESIHSLKICVESLDGLHNDIKDNLTQLATIRQEIGVIKQSLTESQEAQDVVLNDIKTILSAVTPSIQTVQDSLSNQIQNVTNQLTRNLDTATTGLQQSFREQKGSMDQLSQSLNAANTALSGISPLIQTTQSSLSNQMQNDTNQLTQSMNAATSGIKDVVEKRVNKLQIIVIIQLILIAAGIVAMVVLK